MSDIKVTIDNDPEDSPVVGDNDHVGNADTVASTVKDNPAPPLKFYHENFQMLVSNNMQLRFRIPSGFAGRYEVWMNYRRGPNVEVVFEPQLFEAGQWLSIYVSGLKDGTGQFEGYWSIWGDLRKQEFNVFLWNHRPLLMMVILFKGNSQVVLCGAVLYTL